MLRRLSHAFDRYFYPEHPRTLDLRNVIEIVPAVTAPVDNEQQILQAKAIDDAGVVDNAEFAYWAFDARRKGYGTWLLQPQAERDAFKCIYNEAFARGVRFSNAEVNSGTTRIRHAEGLISQLPDTHEGRNTWLLNYGIGDEAVELRRRRGVEGLWDEKHQCLETVGR